MSIDPNIGGSTPLGPVGPVGPVSGTGESGGGEEQDPTTSTLSPSQQEALMMLYLMNFPVLAEPRPDGTWSVTPESIGAIVATKTAEIGSKLWDSYLDYLAEQKERIKEYLESPRYQAFLEVQSPAFISKTEGDTSIRSSAEYNAWINSLPAAAREEELYRGRAIELWTNIIDGVSNYMRDAQAGDAAFMAASFVIASTFIGNYMNIVDVASTSMTTVNPIQEAAGSLVNILPQTLQETFALTVNLFAIGLMSLANAEAISNSLRTGKPPVTEEAVDAFVKSVLEKVQGNQVNAFLLAILVNKFGTTGEVTNERMQQLIAMAKLAMLSIAMAALYESSTGWLTAEAFEGLIEGGVEAKSDEDKARFVDKFSPLRQEFLNILEEGVVGYDDYEKMMMGLARFFNRRPGLDGLLDPVRIYSKIAEDLERGEHAV